MSILRCQCWPHTLCGSVCEVAPSRFINSHLHDCVVRGKKSNRVSIFPCASCFFPLLFVRIQYFVWCPISVEKYCQTKKSRRHHLIRWSPPLYEASEHLATYCLSRRDLHFAHRFCNSGWAAWAGWPKSGIDWAQHHHFVVMQKRKFGKRCFTPITQVTRLLVHTTAVAVWTVSVQSYSITVVTCKSHCVL